MNLRAKLLLIFISSLAASVLVFSAAFSISDYWIRRVRNADKEILLERNSANADYLAFSLSGLDSRDAREFLDKYSLERWVSMMFLSADGTMLYNDLDPTFSAEDETSLLYSLPYVQRVVSLAGGSVRLIYRDMVAESDDIIFFYRFFIVMALSVFTFFMSFTFFSRRIIRDISLISQHIEHISHGRLDCRIKLRRKDELRRLVDNVNLMAESIKNMLSDIEGGERRNRDLIVGISHDLKTPLTSMIGYLGLLKNRDKPLHPEETLRYADICYRQSLRIKRLAGNLHEYIIYSGRTHAGERELFSLRTLVEQSVEGHSVTLDNAGLNLEWTSEDDDMNIHADPRLIARLMDNLLVNLEKHARPRTTAHLDLVETPQGFEVSLSNSAPGFSPDNPDRLFGRMVKGDASRNDGDGSGLGLALCREIALLHGGSIQIEAPGDLFVIRFVLPKYGRHSHSYPFMIRPESGE